VFQLSPCRHTLRKLRPHQEHPGPNAVLSSVPPWFPVFIPLDSVTSDGSWTDPNSVWSLWTLEDPVDCFNMGYSTASVQLRHLITARLIRMGGPCRSSSSDSNIQAASINMIGIAEGRGSQFSVYHIDQNRFMLSHSGGDSEPRAVQSTPTDLAVLDCLPLDDHLFASARASLSLSTVAPGCSRLHLLSACPFRSENSIFMWSPENDRVQHLVYEISLLLFLPTTLVHSYCLKWELRCTPSTSP